MSILKIVESVAEVFDDLHTSEEEREEAWRENRKLGLEELQLVAESDRAQNDVNREEARNPGLFIAGWRPFIGWISGTVLALYYIPYAIVSVTLWGWLSIESRTLQPRPEIGLAEIIGLLGSMLGMSLSRSYEKSRGIATTRVGPS